MRYSNLMLVDLRNAFDMRHKVLLLRLFNGNKIQPNV